MWRNFSAEPVSYTHLDVYKRQALERRDLELLGEIAPFRGIPFPISKILDFHFIKFRFGRIALNYFDTFSKYVYDNLNTIFYESSRDTEYVWGVYFAPASTFVKVDAIFASMHFELSLIHIFRCAGIPLSQLATNTPPSKGVALA